MLKLSESEKGNILKLKYNGKEFTLDESSYGDYHINYNVESNVFVKFRYLNNVITITLFNKDKWYYGQKRNIVYILRAIIRAFFVAKFHQRLFLSFLCFYVRVKKSGECRIRISAPAGIRTQVFGLKIRNDWLSPKNNHICGFSSDRTTPREL